MNKRHAPEQIVRKLREADAELAAGASIPEVARKIGISEATFHRWRNQYGGMKADAMKHLKELEKENARLKKLVAEQALDISILTRLWISARMAPPPARLYLPLGRQVSATSKGFPLRELTFCMEKPRTLPSLSTFSMTRSSSVSRKKPSLRSKVTSR